MRDDPRTSIMSSSSAHRLAPVSLGPLEATSTNVSTPCILHPRSRRPRRVLYPACRSRRPLPREAPDRACRWLLLLSALVFLQICTEETHTCAEVQSQFPDLSACQAQEGEVSVCAATGRTGEEPWRVQTVGGASDQLECVVA